MKISEKISQAKAKLLVDYPYFGTLASKLELVVNDDIATFKSNGAKLEYREEYLRELSLPEVEFILSNGAMHAVLAHDMRKNNRSGWLWQMATDIAINDMLLQNGLDMPYGAEYRERFRGMYAEEIYAELKDDILREDEALEYEADDSDDIEQKNHRDTKEQLQEELLAEQLRAEEAIALLESQLHQNAEIPTAIERFFEIKGFAKIDWREQLREAIDEFMRDDYVLMPPSKKLLYKGIYLPSNSSKHLRLVIAVDVSGSVEKELLDTFLSEVSFVMEQTQNYTIELLACDDTIQSHTSFYTGEPLEVLLKGGGGTDFRPVFRYIEEHFDNVRLVLYFTDLEGIFPKEAPLYSVKWVSPKEGDVPFGSVIVLED
jgi:predicted metal-dependent peptidase